MSFIAHSKATQLLTQSVYDLIPYVIFSEIAACLLVCQPFGDHARIHRQALFTEEA